MSYGMLRLRIGVPRWLLRLRKRMSNRLQRVWVRMPGWLLWMWKRVPHGLLELWRQLSIELHIRVYGRLRGMWRQLRFRLSLFLLCVWKRLFQYMHKCMCIGLQLHVQRRPKVQRIRSRK